MADYHSVYKGPEGETTQWQDIQAKLGNYIAKPKPARFTPFDVEEHEVRIPQKAHPNTHTSTHTRNAMQSGSMARK